jgi:hypothetical protein
MLPLLHPTQLLTITAGSTYYRIYRVNVTGVLIKLEQVPLEASAKIVLYPHQLA